MVEFFAIMCVDNNVVLLSIIPSIKFLQIVVTSYTTDFLHWKVKCKYYQPSSQQLKDLGLPSSENFVSSNAHAIQVLPRRESIAQSQIRIATM